MASAGMWDPVDDHRPLLEELEAMKARERIEELKERNKALMKGRQKLQSSIISHSDNQFYAKQGLKDLKDRAKFVIVASNKNPGPIAQYAPGMTCPPPHDYYANSTSKVRNIAMKMLHEEAMKEAGRPVSTDTGQRKTSMPLPANFSPHQGDNANSLRRQPDNLLLGLRSSIHWTATRRPAAQTRRKPNIFPKTTPGSREMEPTAAWLSREGLPDMSRSRLHISRLAGQTASAPLLQ
mmetsp:Transcript_55644/g.88255  ORF Transcript_55644/g.88255 Transcript_55644/m.88255 type:complete len:237 (+) Transcript_55644:81-791(+)